MKSFIKKTAATLMLGIGMAGAAHAADINVTGNIGDPGDPGPHPYDSPWTKNNAYHLVGQIYVYPGATLVIEAGTVISSVPTIPPAVSGSLAICRGAQIFVNGTQTDPVIMTSTLDTATWTGGNPKTGVWREKCSEWGNLTVMGNAYISENIPAGQNTAAPNAANFGVMEGLTEAFPGDTRVRYGGGDDDDDSGDIHYLSLRYGGRVAAPTVELNGLSVGGVGRGTDIHHIDIMNNVDDGIETWGGTVNYKYVNIWNIGDDCFDVDQGWRGKAQFGLLVQGFSQDANQGSGVGDNMFETDGAEQADCQPVTTATIYNFTVIGQPVDGDQGTAWRDEARMQYRNCIFMDLGEELIKLDNVDGDGGLGYGLPGTLSWASCWTTPYTTLPTNNPFPVSPASHYTAQSAGTLGGMLCEMTDCVFFENPFATAYTTATAVGAYPGGVGNNNVDSGAGPGNSPIKAITRHAPEVKGTKTMLRVTSLDPRPANDALTSSGSAPADGFFTPSAYRGAFEPGETWLSGWTASYAYGFTPSGSPWGNLGRGLAGVTGVPDLDGNGTCVGSTPCSLVLTNAKPSSPAALFVGLSNTPANFKGGKLVPVPWVLLVSLTTNGAGSITLPFNWPPSVPSGVSLYFQYGVKDTAAILGVSLSNAEQGTTP